MQETQVQSLGLEDPLEKELSTHSSIPAWEIPWTEEPGKLQSTGLQKVRHSCSHALSKAPPISFNGGHYKHWLTGKPESEHQVVLFSGFTSSELRWKFEQVKLG